MAIHGRKSFAFGQINTHIRFERIDDDRVKAVTTLNGTDFEQIAPDEATAARELTSMLREKVLSRSL